VQTKKTMMREIAKQVMILLCPEPQATNYRIIIILDETLSNSALNPEP